MGGVLQVILIYLTASCIVEFCSSLGGDWYGSCECGRKNPQLSSRIVGGSETGVNEYPWIVYLNIRKNNENSHCGGSIINDRFILTAAHCVEGRNESDVSIYMGDHDISTYYETHVQIQYVQAIFIHENYRRNPTENNVALIKTGYKIKFNDIVSPICLPEPGEDFSGEVATVIGWGRTNFSGNGTEVLRKVQVRVLSDRECRAESNNRIRHFPEVLCAIGNRKGVCFGDFGGPLMVQNKFGQYEQIGVARFTVRCSQLGYPHGYVRVTEYLDWIRKHVNYCSKGQIVYKTY